MRLLITGAAGMLGTDVRRAAEAAGHEVTGLARTELDITDPGSVSQALRTASPDVVINCAAYTDVDGAEREPAAAQAVNSAGAGHVAAAAAAAGAWTLHISSDYVFDGAKRAPYVESDPTQPLSVYGASKLAGEHAVARAASGRHTVIRTSWLFGAAGPCFPATILRLAGERDELTVVDDQVGCPTFTAHLAVALVRLAADPHRPAGTVHLAAGGQCSWYEFAQEILADADAGAGAGVATRLTPGSTAELGRPAARPAYSVLRTERTDFTERLPDWKAGLAAYLEARVVAR